MTTIEQRSRVPECLAHVYDVDALDAKYGSRENIPPPEVPGADPRNHFDCDDYGVRVVLSKERQDGTVRLHASVSCYNYSAFEGALRSKGFVGRNQDMVEQVIQELMPTMLLIELDRFTSAKGVLHFYYQDL